MLTMITREDRQFFGAGHGSVLECSSARWIDIDDEIEWEKFCERAENTFDRIVRRLATRRIEYYVRDCDADGFAIYYLGQIPTGGVQHEIDWGSDLIFYEDFRQQCPVTISIDCLRLDAGGRNHYQVWEDGKYYNTERGWRASLHRRVSPTILGLE